VSWEGNNKTILNSENKKFNEFVFASTLLAQRIGE
jgi:hypothetical protein